VVASEQTTCNNFKLIPGVVSLIHRSMDACGTSHALLQKHEIDE
jgi:hypothetical protein